MIKQKLPIAKLTPITVWVTSNVAIYRQLGFWHDTKKVYEFVPVNRLGYVIITETEKEIECKPLLGYSLYRPATLNLSWLADKTVNFREISMATAGELYGEHPKGWQRIHV